MRYYADDADYCPHCGEECAVAFKAVKDVDGDFVLPDEDGISMHVDASGHEVFEAASSVSPIPVGTAEVYVHASSDPDAVDRLAMDAGLPLPDHPGGG